LVNLKKLPAALVMSLSLIGAALPSTAALAAPDSSSGSGAAVVDRAVRDVAARQPGGTVHVLVQRKSNSGGADRVRSHGGTVRHELKTANAVAAEVPASRLDELARDPDVARIAFDAPMAAQATSDPLSASKLLTLYPSILGAPSAWSYSPRVRGTGIGVAVLDSGINTSATDFFGTEFMYRGGEAPAGVPRVVKSVAIAQENAGSPQDDYGHGTWVAGILAGRGWNSLYTASDDNQYVGIAPDANLINIKVSDRNGMAQTSDVIAGLEWVIENKDAYNIKVANLSLVSATAESYTTSVLDAAVELAWFQGITVVVSAGNAGPNTMQYPPANDPFVIVVGATDDKGTLATSDDQVAPFSSYGTTQDGFAKPDVVAPGRHIVGTLASTSSPLAQAFPNNVVGKSYIRLSGTSAAAPMVSGVVADLAQTAKLLNVALTPDQYKWLLQRTAQAVGGPGTGVGYPNVFNAGTYLNSNPTGIGRANQGITPNGLLLAAFQSANGGATWNNVSWNNVSWNNVSWNNVSWNNVSWNNVSWNNVSWNNVSWNNVSWEDVAGT
jgi:serine protease AprX